MSLRTVVRNIGHIPSKLLKGGEQALLEAARLMAGLAQVHVRVEWGNLRDTIRVERGEHDNIRFQVKVKAGGLPMKRGPRAGQLVDYAGIVEAKYPYMKPAWDEVRPQVEALIRAKCMAELKSVEEAGVLHFP